MKRVFIITMLVFIIGISTSIFRHKIMASAPIVIDEGKILVNIVNDSKKPVRIYVNQQPDKSTLVNPGRIYMQQIRSGDTVNVYSPEQNTTFHVTLTDTGKKELLGKSIQTSVEQLRNTTNKQTLSGLGVEIERGSTNYLNIEEEAVPPYETELTVGV